MALDEFGKVAVAEIVFYIPVFFIALFVAVKHGFSRRGGWLFLCTFSLVRIVGAAILIASKTMSNAPVGLITAAAVLQGIGLAPLMLATLGFIGQISEHGLPSSDKVLRLTRIALSVAVGLGAAGGVKASPTNQPSSISTGRTLTRVSGVLFIAAYASLFGLHVLLWKARQQIPTHHRTLLSGVSVALLPLFLRIVYSLCGDFASSSQSRWSPVSGDWRIYLVLGLIMEYLVVCVYITTGTLTPLHKDEEVHVKSEAPYRPSRHELLEMGRASNQHSY